MTAIPVREAMRNTLPAVGGAGQKVFTKAGGTDIMQVQPVFRLFRNAEIQR